MADTLVESTCAALLRRSTSVGNSKGVRTAGACGATLKLEDYLIY